MLLAFTVSLGDGGLWGRGGEGREEKRGENEGKGENAFLDFNVLSTAQSRSPQEARGWGGGRERQTDIQTETQRDEMGERKRGRVWILTFREPHKVTLGRQREERGGGGGRASERETERETDRQTDRQTEQRLMDNTETIITVQQNSCQLEYQQKSAEITSEIKTMNK